ncbi:MAG: glycosyltransferase [Tenuifilaceae bacterium]
MILLGVISILALAYIGLIIAFTVGLEKAFVQNSKNSDLLNSISVIVAFKNEASNLPILIDSLMNQTFPKDKFEIILVNDHSSDESVSIVEQFISLCSNLKLVHLPEEKSGKKAAIACGINSAQYELIAITDADCKPSNNWLKEISTESSIGSVLIIGPVIMTPIKNFSQKIQSLEYASLMATAAGSCGIGHPVIASSANLAFRNDLLNVSETTLNPKVSSGDDMFILHHAKQLKKGRITFLGSESAIVQTSTATTLNDALNQRKRWASKSVFYKDFDTIISGFVVLSFNLGLVILLILSLFQNHLFIYFLALFIAKSLVDYLLVSRYLHFVGQKELLKVFLPLQLIYPFYISYSFFAGILIRGSWKGKKIK